MAPRDAELVARALAYALEAHTGQTRKGSEVPYVTHCLRVAALVLEHGGTPEQVAMAFLHDTLEDCDDTDEALLRKHFGDVVAEGVVTLSDTLPGDRAAQKSPWRLRKEAYLVRLANADAMTQQVAACDKLDNLRCLVRDLEKEGLATLERFSASPDQTRWYYESVRSALVHASPAVMKELDDLLVVLARFIPAPSVHSL